MIVQHGIIMGGRGSLATQTILPAYRPALLFGHNEESTGQGAAAIAASLQQRGSMQRWSLIEGGEITREQLPDVPRPIALIGIGEKAMPLSSCWLKRQADIHRDLKRRPPSISLSRALYKLRGEQTPRRILDPTREFLSRVRRFFR